MKRILLLILCTFAPLAHGQKTEQLALTPRAKGPEHPFFGPLTNGEWNALQWKHIKHHLKQFGL